MSLKVLSISGSPRGGGNTDVLLECFSEGIASTGVQTETVFLRDYFIQPKLHKLYILSQNIKVSRIDIYVKSNKNTHSARV